MSLTAMSLTVAGPIIRNISLFAVLVYELVGPLLTKIALDKAGEIPEKPVPPRLQAEIDAKTATAAENAVFAESAVNSAEPVPSAEKAEESGKK